MMDVFPTLSVGFYADERKHAVREYYREENSDRDVDNRDRAFDGMRHNDDDRTSAPPPGKADKAADLYNLSMIAYNSGNLDVSLDYINQAIALSAANAETRTTMLLKRAEIYADLGNYDLAESGVREVLAASPGLAEAYFVSALVNYKTENLAGAQSDLEQALTLDPAFARAHNLQGNILKERGELAGALNAYNDAITGDPTFAPAYFNRAEVEMAVNNYETAITDYSSAIDRYTDLQKRYLAQAYCGRGRAFLMLGNAEMASRDRERAQLLFPGACEREEETTAPRWGKGEVRPPQ